MTNAELLHIRTDELQAGDLVLLSDGDRKVDSVPLRYQFSSDGRPRTVIYWADGTSSTWLAAEPVEVVRR